MSRKIPLPKGVNVFHFSQEHCLSFCKSRSVRMTFDIMTFGRPQRAHERPFEGYPRLCRVGAPPRQTERALLGECGTYKTVNAIFWPWLSGKSPENILGFPLFARRRRATGDRQRAAIDRERERYRCWANMAYIKLWHV